MKLFIAVLLIDIVPSFAIAQQRGNATFGSSQSMSSQPMSSQPMTSQQGFNEQRSMGFSPQPSSSQAERSEPAMSNGPSMQFSPQQSSFQQEQPQPSFNNAANVQYSPQESNIQVEQQQRAVSDGSNTSTQNVSSPPREEYPTEASRWLPENDFAQPKAKPVASIPQPSVNVSADRSIQVQPRISLPKAQGDLAHPNMKTQPHNSPSTADVLTYHAKKHWMKDTHGMRLRKNHLVRPTNFLRLYANEPTGPLADLTEFCSQPIPHYCCDTSDTICPTKYLRFQE
jgi:hypothetical protein